MSTEFRIDAPPSEFIDTDEAAVELLRLAMRKVDVDPGDLLGFDTETHGKKVPIKKKPLDWMNDTVTYWSLSFRVDDVRRRWCIAQQYFMFFAPLLENPKAWFACWNAKYDAHISWNCGINIWNAHIVDGLALTGLHDENKRIKGLKACAADYCGYKMTSYKSLFDGILDAEGKKAKEYETSLVELVELGHEDRVANYASYDAFAHLVTVEWLIEKLKNTPIGMDGYSLWQLFLDVEIYYTETLWRMERRGMLVDTEYLKSKVPIIQGQIDVLEKDINRIAGYPLNIASPKQVGEFFFTEKGLNLEPVKMTATQQYSTDAEVMEALDEAGVHVARMIKEVRTLSKFKSTYIDPLVTMSEYYEDGRIHPTNNQVGTVTGRLSGENPNPHNMLRPDGDEWGIRRAFIAPEGKKLIVGDYEQVEMRIMADLAQDKKMLKAIREGKDIHSFTVSVMNPGVSYEDVVEAKKAEKPTERQQWLKRERQAKKSIGFGIIYGAGPPKISTGIEISEADWHAKIDEMDDNTFNRRVGRLMKKNPLFTEEQAVEQVGRHSVAGEKIKEYFEAFPAVKGFMDQTPVICRHRMAYDENNNPREWEFELRQPGTEKPISECGHFRPFGYVQTLSGRYRRLEDIDHKNFFYRSEAERQATNARIQGGAADICKAAMLRIDHCPILNALGVLILNQVHDEIVMECPEENVEEAMPIIKQYMEHPFGDEPEDEALSIPIPVDLKDVDNWAMAK